jgi:hypothetical protein
MQHFPKWPDLASFRHFYPPRFFLKSSPNFGTIFRIKLQNIACLCVHFWTFFTIGWLLIKKTSDQPDFPKNSQA